MTSARVAQEPPTRNNELAADAVTITKRLNLVVWQKRRPVPISLAHFVVRTEAGRTHCCECVLIWFEILGSLGHGTDALPRLETCTG